LKWKLVRTPDPGGLVVRDGYASFFYNPEDSISYLKQTVAGIKALGYTFVSPTSA
jgi:hypothetical protein